MKKIGIVSCDKWQEKINEDINLKIALKSIGLDAEIISWQKSTSLEDYDLLILRSVWGYQNDYNNFKNWLLEIKKKRINLVNSPDIVLTNILKNKQFEILRMNNIDCIDTYFLEKEDFNSKNLKLILNGVLHNIPSVIKPTISGSGENTFLVNPMDKDKNLPNIIFQEDIIKKYHSILANNSDCSIMLQPYIEQINDGEYSCIFIDGELTHTMLRFPDVFHDKKRPYLVIDPPKSILELAKRVESIKDFSNYLYMRVDMVLIGEEAKIMEVELAEPDLLTKYIDDKDKQDQVIKTLAKKIERRVK